MHYAGKLVGREQERQAIGKALDAALAGSGQLLLLGGEAGMGKTRLADELLSSSGELTLKYACQEHRTPAFAPVTAILRQYLRLTSGDLSDCGALASYLNLLMPELGPVPANAGDQPTLHEAIRAALATLSAERPAAILIDDLHWADNATLDVILSLSPFLAEMSIALIAIYRSDEIPRGHPVRNLKNQLRRARAATELTLGPLDAAGTAAMAEAVLGRPVAPSLTGVLHEKSEGIPLFVEQLIAALESDGRLQPGEQGLQLADDDQFPLPESIRDAVLLRLDNLAEPARRLAEAAAVAGESFSLEQVIELARGDDGLEALLERRILTETSPGQAAFHHALTREAVYQEIIWTRRRGLHRALAQRLSDEGAPAEIVANHWLAAQETDEARDALVEAAQHACHIHAYRDATGFGDQALEMWPEGHDEETRLAVLDRLGNCAQLSGLLPEAVRAWREAAEGRRKLGQMAAYAETKRRLAATLELQNAWTQAVTAHSEAAEAFQQVGLAAEAATASLSLAGMLQYQGQYSQAIQSAEDAMRLAQESSRSDLLVRAQGLYGQLLARLGRPGEGVEQVQEALALAMDLSLTGAAAEAFMRLGSALEQAADYSGSRATYQGAADYCRAQGEAATGIVCQICLAGVLWRLGEWDKCMEMALELIENPDTHQWVRASAKSVVGRVLAFRGSTGRARPLLQETLMLSRKQNNFVVMLYAEFGLAVVNAQERKMETATEHWGQAIAAWEASEDLHFGTEPFRWGVTQFAQWRDGPRVQQAVSALSRIATGTSNPETLAGLAHGLGESLLLEGEKEKAVEQFEQATTLLEKGDAPLDRAHSRWRLGVALAATGQAERAVAALQKAAGTFERLGAKPYQAEVEKELVALGAHAVPLLSPRQSRRLKQAGLTGRQVEVLRKLAQGMTNRDIAAELVLSPRTVEMHVANVLNKLGCNNRAEAVARGAELGLLETTDTP
jgi:DNA-binding CsgD family transcriptional regulator/exonuclease VII small subunit